MRAFIFILFSILIGYLTRDIWLTLNPWYYKIVFLSAIILIPFILYSLAAEIALETGWFSGALAMMIIMVIDNYFTNAVTLCIISKCNRSLFDLSGFSLSLSLLNLPWYSYLISGIMGAITGAIGDKQRRIARENEQKALFLGVFLLAGQFLGIAVPELTPIISRVTPVVTTVLTAEIATKTGSVAAAESTKITDKNILNKTEPAVVAITEQAAENILKVRYFKYSFIKNGQKMIVNIPDFSKQSVFKTRLPPNLYIASDEIQFAKSNASFAEQLKTNPRAVELLKNKNIEMLKRDRIYYENNKTEIVHAQDQMLAATKNKDLVEQVKWLKELRRRTQKITFIHTPKGKPIVILDEEQILTKQLNDIYNPSSGSQSRIFGYVWHHSQKQGVMELVSKDIHEYNRHVGGNAIWGQNIR